MEYFQQPLIIEDCPGIQSGVSGVEVPSQFTSVIKPIQDCEANITREDQSIIIYVILII